MRTARIFAGQHLSCKTSEEEQAYKRHKFWRMSTLDIIWRGSAKLRRGISSVFDSSIFVGDSAQTKQVLLLQASYPPCLAILDLLKASQLNKAGS